MNEILFFSDEGEAMLFVVQAIKVHKADRKYTYRLAVYRSISTISAEPF